MVATTVTYPRFPSLGKITIRISRLTDTQNINQGYTSLYILKPQYRPHYIRFGVPDVNTDHFTSKNMQHWTLEQGVHGTVTTLNQSQAAGLIEHHYDILKQIKV